MPSTSKTLHERGQSATQEALKDSHAPSMTIVRTQQLSPFGICRMGPHLHLSEYSGSAVLSSKLMPGVS